MPQELTTTSLSVHTELLHRGAADALARWLLPAALIGGVLAAALIVATFGTQQPRSIDQALAPLAFADSPKRGAVPAVEGMKIVPADALVTDVSWSPLTGDGSN